MNPFATDVVTLYIQHVGADKKVVWTRVVLHDVQFSQKMVRVVEPGGSFRVLRQTTVSVPAEVVVQGREYVDPKEYLSMDDGLRAACWTLKKDDVIVLGERSEEITETFRINVLKSLCDSYATINAVSDNTRHAVLPHWQVEAV